MAPHHNNTRRFIRVLLALAAGFVPATAQVVQDIAPRAAEVGTVVQLAGSGFDPMEAYALHFEGSVAGPATAVTTTSLDVTIPAGARTGEIVLEVGSTGAMIRTALPLTVLRQVGVQIDPALAVYTAGYVTGTVYGDAAPTAPVPVGHPGFVYAGIPDNDAPALIGMTTETTAALTLNAETTAAALILLAPHSHTPDPVEQESRMPGLVALAETQALATLIDASLVSGVDYLDDPGYGNALVAAINAYVISIPDPPPPPLPPVGHVTQSQQLASGGGASFNDDFINEQLLFTGNTPINLPHDDTLPDELVAVAETGGVALDGNGLPHRELGFNAAQEFLWLPFNPLDWVVTAYEIDPWGGGRFPDGAADLAGLSNTNDVFPRLRKGSPIDQSVFAQNTYARKISIFGFLRDLIAGDHFAVDKPTLWLPADRPGLYVLRANSGAIWPWQVPLASDLPDGVQRYVEAMSVNAVLCALDLASAALSGQELISKSAAKTAITTAMKAARNNLSRIYVNGEVDIHVLLTAIKDLSTSLIKSLTKEILKLVEENAAKVALQKRAKAIVKMIDVVDRLGTAGKAYHRQEALFNSDIPPFLGIAPGSAKNAAAIETAIVAVGNPWAPVITRITPAAAHRGQTIRIEGKNLRSGAFAERLLDFDGPGGLPPVAPLITEQSAWLVKVPMNVADGPRSLTAVTSFGEGGSAALASPDDVFTVLPDPVITSTYPDRPVIGKPFALIGQGFSENKFELDVASSSGGVPLTEFASTPTAVVAGGLSAAGNQTLQVRILDPDGTVVLSSNAYPVTVDLPTQGQPGAMIQVTSLADNLLADDFVTLREALRWASEGTNFRTPTAGEGLQISGTLDASNLGRADIINFPYLSAGDVIQIDPALGALPWPKSFDTVFSHVELIIDGGGMDAHGLVLSNIENFSVTNLKFRNFGQWCIWVRSATGNTLQDMQAENCGPDGIRVDEGSQRNRFINIGVSGANGDGIHVNGMGTDYNEFTYFFGAGSRSAREIRDNGLWGLRVDGGAKFNVLHPGDILNNARGGIWVAGINTTDNSFGYFDRVFPGEAVMEVRGNGGDGLRSNAPRTRVRFLRIGNNTGDGILLEGPNHVGSQVSSCTIGLTEAGGDDHNGLSGIHLRGGVNDVLLGDRYRQGFNVGRPSEIGGNWQHGIWLEGPDVHDVTINAARVGAGFNSAPNAPWANLGHGVAVTDGSHDNTIGDRNDAIHLEIVGHQSGAGIYLDGPQTTGNVIVGNEIGRFYRLGAWPDNRSDAALGNRWGIKVTNSAWDNTIGERGEQVWQYLPLDYSVTDPANGIYASTEAGILLESGGDPAQSFPMSGPVTPRGANVVQNNVIGATGTARRNLVGIRLRDRGLANRIGGSHWTEANTIQGNAKAGIWIDSLVTSNPNLANRIVGNRINESVGDYFAPEPLDEITDGVGILVTNSQNQKIGGTTIEEANWFSHNQVGIQIHNSTHIDVELNYIGFEWRDRHEVAGIIISDSFASRVSRNQILGNAYHVPAQGRGGLALVGGGDHTVKGNYFGTSADGKYTLANAPWGILIQDSESNLIGGAGDDANVIVKSDSHGIWLRGADCRWNSVRGNWIGVKAQDLATSANLGAGIMLSGGAHGNLIGDDLPITIDGYSTTTPGANVIQGNGAGGIVADGAATTGNSYLNNSISGHTTPAIQNQNGANGGILPPTIIDVIDGVASGVTNGVATGSRVQVFSDADDEGEVWVGETTTAPDGSWEASLMAVFDLQFRAAVTDAATGSTSELGGAFTQPGAIEFSLDSDVVLPTNAPTGAVNLVALPLRVRAVEISGNVVSLYVRPSGTLHDGEGILGVSVYRDVDGNAAVDTDDPLLGGPAPFSDDDGFAQIDLDQGWLANGSTQRWLVTVDLAGGATVGTDFELEITAASDVDATTVYAQSPLPVTGVFPIASGPITVEAGAGLGAQRLFTVSNDPGDAPNFIELQTAVDTVLLEGTRIEILPGLTGTYAENLVLNVPSIVTLSGGGQVVLDGLGGTAVTVAGTSAPVNLDGLTLAGAIGLSASADTTVRNVTFRNSVIGAELLAGDHVNTRSLWPAGGMTGIHVAAPANLQLGMCEMHQQVAKSLEVLGTARVESCLIVEGGTGVWADSGSIVEIDGSTIADQILAGVESIGGSTLSIDGSILWGNTGGDYLGGLCDDVNYSIVGSPDCSAVNSNLWADPIFTGSPPEPYALDPASPAIDAGRPPAAYDGSPPFDLTGDLRLRDYDGDFEAEPDMGAYELAPPTPRLPVAGLSFTDKDSFGWAPVGGALDYHIHRGAIPGLGYGDYGVCRDDLDVDRTDTLASDNGTPAAGTVWFYAVTADDGVSEGTLGFGTSAERSLFSSCP